MKYDIQIRKAVGSDLDNIEKLYGDICDYLETHENYPGWKKSVYPIRSDAEKALAANELYVACFGGRTAGTIVLKHEPEEGYKNGKWLTEDDYERIYVVYALAVHPDFLKCGIGTELLMFAEGVARKEQCVSIRLDVVKGNIPAERLLTGVKPRKITQDTGTFTRRSFMISSFQEACASEARRFLT